MQEIGIPHSGQYSKGFREYIRKVHFSYLIPVCGEADKNFPTFPQVAQRLHSSFEDPAAFEGSEDVKIAKFRKVRDEIEQRVREWLENQ
jgi:arsenate reductase